MHLDTEMNHELAVDRVSMTYSWHNINAEYGNKAIKYSKDNGSTWKTITFVDGMYLYDDLSDYINQVITDNDDEPSNNRIGVKNLFRTHVIPCSRRTREPMAIRYTEFNIW